MATYLYTFENVLDCNVRIIMKSITTGDFFPGQDTVCEAGSKKTLACDESSAKFIIGVKAFELENGHYELYRGNRGQIKTKAIHKNHYAFRFEVEDGRFEEEIIIELNSSAFDDFKSDFTGTHVWFLNESSAYFKITFYNPSADCCHDDRGFYGDLDCGHYKIIQGPGMELLPVLIESDSPGTASPILTVSDSGSNSSVNSVPSYYLEQTRCAGYFSDHQPDSL